MTTARRRLARPRSIARVATPAPRDASARPGSSCSSSASRRCCRWRCSPPRRVTVKLLPFDNKSELQVVVDLPEGAIARGHRPRARRPPRAARATLPEVRLGPDLCRHRRAVQLQRPRAPLLSAQPSPSWATCRSISRRKAERDRASHDIALDLRERLEGLPAAATAPSSRSSRCRPGRRCIATLLAEIYGPDAETAPRGRREGARDLPRACPSSSTSTISFGEPRAAPARSSIDQDNLEFYGVEQRDVYDTIAGAISAA